MDYVLQSLQEMGEDFLRITPRLILALVVIAILFGIGRLVGRAIALFFSRHGFNSANCNFFRGLAHWFFIVLGVIIALNLLGFRGVATSIVAGGGLTALLLGVALRGIGENLMAGFFLAFSRPFEVGNLIRSGDFEGIVRSVGLRSTHIRSVDGRDIFIPSANLVNNPLINFTSDGLRRISFTLPIDYKNDPARARRLLFETTQTVPFVLSDPAPGVLVKEFKQLYLEVEVFVWVNMFQRGVELPAVRSAAMEQCRATLIANGFKVSSDITSNVALEGTLPELPVRVNSPDSDTPTP